MDRIVSSKTPPEIAAAGVEDGAASARRSWDGALVAGLVAGAYIAVAGLLAIVVSAGVDPKIWGSIHTLLWAAVFSIGLVLLVVAAPPWLLLPSAGSAEPLSPPAVPKAAPEAARSR
jgi:formate/nitrite transporter FocA (FNT family)